MKPIFLKIFLVFLAALLLFSGCSKAVPAGEGDGAASAGESGNSAGGNSVGDDSAVISSETTFAVDGQTVENGYNNYVAGGRLCRVGNALFFSTSRGIVRLDGSQARLADANTQRLMAAGETFYVRSEESSDVLRWNRETEKLEAGEIFLREDPKLERRVFFDDEVNPDKLPALWDCYYYTADGAYYADFAAGTVKRCSADGKQEVVVAGFDAKTTLSQLMVCDGAVIWLDAQGRLFCSAGTGETARQLCDFSVNGFNLLDNTLLIAADSGLWRINLPDGAPEQLAAESAQSCYAVDDRWIYFIDGAGNLLRTAGDGSAGCQRVWTAVQ